MGYYTYKNRSFTCKICGWTGLGSEAAQGETFSEGFEIDCPKCFERIPGLILFPTFEEMLEYGTDEEKNQANAKLNWNNKYFASLIADINQLPELPGDFLTFVLREVNENGVDFILITESDQFICKEMRAYEYYERFIELGELLKLKYGDRMIDLVPDLNGLYLYGDRSLAIDIIKKFRMKLRTGKSNK